MKNIIIAITLIIVGFIGYLFYQSFTSTVEVVNEQEKAEMATENSANQDTSTSSDETMNEEGSEPVNEKETVIGSSVNGNEITAYHYGTGDKEILFVGGVHGGYDWNTVSVAYELMDYLDKSPNQIPEGVKVTIIPALNPDGLEKVVGSAGRFSVSDVPSVLSQTVAGRYNANDVDLNRNFDCDWQSEGVWQQKKVSGGSQAFSEPESQAIASYVDSHNLTAAVVWYSAAGGVFASNCHNEVLADTKILTNTYAKASGYKAYEDFDFYEVTGDMVNWLAKKDIPAISVLLSNHTDVEWDRNRKGIEAVLEFYSE